MISFHLCQSRYARFYHVAKFISIHHLRKTTAVSMHMRPWTNQAHLSFQHINKLREFIQIRSSQYSANPGNTPVVFFRMLGMTILIHKHGSELQAPKTFSPAADSFLYKKN